MAAFNTFRPQLDLLEGRALMSATLAPAPEMPSAGKVSYSDLSAVPAPVPQTREHILLARQVGTPVVEETAADADRKWIEIESMAR